MIVSQALSGKAPMLEAQPARAIERGAPALSSARPDRRRRDLEKGVKLTIAGSVFLAIQFFSFLLSLPFQSSGSPFGFFSFVALIVMAAGISKLASARPLVVTLPAASEAGGAYRAQIPLRNTPPERPYERELPFDRASTLPPTPTTSSLVIDPAPSVIEAETEHLPEFVPRNGEQGHGE
jgi:hypothetical protein